ncbi:MAG: helix-turn-helix domain-containing protein [Ruminococcus sp.]|nr:helix-turn-helix domain-containing protein [Ruminococcus sp.]
MPRKRIAVITARADESEQKHILTGISAAALSMDADVAVFSNVYNHWVSDALLNYENHIYDFFQPQQFHGVIITAEAFLSLSTLEDVCDRIRKAGLPAVVIDGEIEGFHSILSQDTAAMEQITEHLITVHGLTRMDILTGAAHMPVSHRRVEGCKKAFATHGLPFDESCVHYGNFWNDAGEALAERYLRGEQPLPQAVICTNDYMAYGLCDALTAGGIAIPQQVTVTGYDYTEGRIYHYPILTTYRRNRQYLGAQAAAYLLGAEVPLPAADDLLICGNTCCCGVNSLQFNEEIRMARIGQYHAAMNSAAQFANRLTLCRTLAEYQAVLQEYAYLLHDAEGLYLCLDKAWNSAEYVGDTFLCCSIGNAYSDQPRYFEGSALLPALWEEREYAMVYYFSPLCFQMRLFGYTALAYRYPKCYDLSFRDWNKTVANTLEFLRMKNDIHYLTQCRRVSSLYDSLTGFYQMGEFRRIADATGTEMTEDCSLFAIQLTFPTEGAYIYGENYRSDILSATARAIKQATEQHGICCRSTDDLFMVLCKAEHSTLMAEKLKIMLHHAIAAHYDETQVFLTFGAYKGKASGEAVDTLSQSIQPSAEEALRRFLQRKQLPHYRALLALRSDIYKSPQKTPSAADAGKLLCISEGYFRAAYKKCFGVSFLQDQIYAKTMRAGYLLCTTAMSIYAVALQCGYSDEKYFARQFKQSMGCSPAQYRERHC